ncbi:MAG TPA: hypothetical protein VLV81_02010 [Acidimicrobiia bacterium]|nr:hypothetical protein [Acidimicrobiia bacterium]
MSPRRSGIVTEQLVVTEPMSFHGIAAAGAVVRAGGQLNLHGILDGDLEVQAGGRVNVYGIVNGEVHNGGIVIVSGIVRGRVHEGSLGAPVTVVGSGSWVNGVERLDQADPAT